MNWTVLTIWLLFASLALGVNVYYLGKWGVSQFKRKWRFSLRLFKLWMRAGVANYSIIFYGMSVWFAILSITFYFFDQFGSNAPNIFLYILQGASEFSLSIPLIFVPLVFLSRISLAKENPATFAQRTIRSHRPAEAIELNCHLILDILNRFERETKKLKTLFDENWADIYDQYNSAENNYAEPTEEQISYLGNLISSVPWNYTDLDVVIHKFLRKNNIQFRRVEALKAEISKQIGMEPRRFCDKFIGFSPSIVEARIHKLEMNFRLINPECIAKHDPMRVAELIAQTRYIFDWLTSIRDEQIEMLHSKYLGLILCKLLSEKSTSTALHTYADAIQYVFEYNKDKYKDERCQQHIEAGLSLLYRKQFAYTNFSPHYLLMSLMQKNDYTNTNQCLTYIAIKNRRANKAKVIKPTCFDENSFNSFLQTTNRFVYKDWCLVKDAFRAELRDCLAKHPQVNRLIILTSGYGRVVRSLVKWIARNLNSPNLGLPQRVTHFSHISTGDNDGLASRLFCQELTNETRVAGVLQVGMPSELGYAGDLVNSLNPNDYVLHLLGIDAFEGDNRIFAQGAVDVLNQLSQCAANQYVTFAVGEQYKSIELIQEAIGDWSPWVDYKDQYYGSLSENIIDLKSRSNIKLITGAAITAKPSPKTPTKKEPEATPL